MKNICLIIDTLKGGGAEKIVMTLASALIKLGARADVIVLSNRVDYSLEDIDFRVHIIEKKKHPIRFIQWKKRAADLHKKINELNIKYDLFISHLSSADEICRQAQQPNLYFCIHNTISTSLFVRYQNSRGFTRWWRKIKYTRAIKNLYKNQNLITVSGGVQQDLLDFGIQPNSIQTIYNPCDFENIREAAQRYNVKDKNYIIHVGSFSNQKRQDILIKAYHKSGVDEKLYLLGDNENAAGEKSRRLVADLNLQDKVIFKGFNPNPYPYIKNAKALILSSDYEGLPGVLIEALILGVPIVSTDCPSGPSEIMTGKLSEFLSPVGNVEALATNIRKMLTTPVEITDDHIARFEAGKVAKQYLALCDDD